MFKSLFTSVVIIFLQMILGFSTQPFFIDICFYVYIELETSYCIEVSAINEVMDCFGFCLSSSYCGRELESNIFLSLLMVQLQ